jgi:succinyl-CoA synthetase beta subunit
MLLLEHQGKALLAEHGIAAPKGIVVSSREALDRVIDGLPARLVLKAQIASGGRSRAGGVAFADSVGQAQAASSALLGTTINGLAVKALLIEERVDFLRERYAALLIEDGEIRLLFGRKGGIDIEDITASDPRNLVSIVCDPIDGPKADELTACFDRLGFAAEYRRAYELLARDLFALARARDALLVEINPLVECRGGKLIALDARIDIDDQALARQPAIAAPISVPSVAKHAPVDFAGLPFRKNPEGGSIAVIGLGGGLNVSLMDWIAALGGKVASLVDIDGALASGHAAQGFAEAFQAYDGDPAIRAILVNVITCGYRLDDIVEGLLQAHAARPPTTVKPMILHLRGNAMARTPAMLAAADCSNSASITDAVTAVVSAAGV